MIIKRKGRLLEYAYIWFENVRSLEKLKGKIKSDFVSIHGNPYVLDGKNCVAQKQYTLLTDLQQNLEDIKLTKTTKNEINRSVRENVEARWFDSQALLENEDVLNKFSEIYHAMYSGKGIEANINKNEIVAYIKGNAFALSVAYINGEAMVFHSYICNGETARLFQSCSDFRSCDKELKNAIGRANKFLHWKDLQALKDKGYALYDWGGVFDFENPNGIDLFKMSFGGEKAEYYNIQVFHSWKAKLLHLMRK